MKRGRAMVRRLTTVAVAAALAAPGVAWAQSEESADALLERGVELRAQGRDDAALDAFRQAYALAPGPRALAQIGLAEQALGRWIEAEAHVREALRADGDPWIAQHRAAIERSLAVISRRVGALEVTGAVPGAEVWIDSRLVGRLPLAAPVRLVAGPATLEVRAVGYAPARRVVRVPPGATAREVVTLVDPDDGSAGRSPQRALGWVALAGAGVFLAGGAVSLVVREGAVDRYNDGVARRLCSGTTVDIGQEMNSDCRADRELASTARSLAIGGFVVGGALAVTSVVLLLTAPRSRATPAATAAARFSCGQGPGALGVACGGAF